MNVLFTNDDGINSGTFETFVDVFSDAQERLIVAPQSEMSAVSHSLTIHKPLFCATQTINGCRAISVQGTPADCVKLALDQFVVAQPDIVISGVNKGSNTGVNIFYSGTVAAAMQAALCGIPAVAVSLSSFNPNSFDNAVKFTWKLAHYICDSKMPEGVFLNVNIPNISSQDIKGIKVTQQGGHVFKDRYVARQTPSGQPYYWLDGEFMNDSGSLCIDHHALSAGWISITPLRYNLTATRNISGYGEDFSRNLFAEFQQS